MNAHTPGPWRYLPDFGEVATDGVADYLILAKLNDYFEGSEDIYHANGRLMAAAPELYDALKNALDYWQGNLYPPSWVERMRKVVATVEGREP